MKVFTVRVMNEPDRESVEKFHERLAEIMLKQYGQKNCEEILKIYSKDK